MVTGQIVPPLEGVSLVMTLEEDGGKVQLETRSDSRGAYAFPAIDFSAVFISLQYFLVVP